MLVCVCGARKTIATTRAFRLMGEKGSKHCIRMRNRLWSEMCSFIFVCVQMERRVDVHSWAIFSPALSTAAAVVLRFIRNLCVAEESIVEKQRQKCWCIACGRWAAPSMYICPMSVYVCCVGMLDLGLVMGYLIERHRRRWWFVRIVYGWMPLYTYKTETDSCCWLYSSVYLLCVFCVCVRNRATHRHMQIFLWF